MADILIRGMEMPQRCKACRFCGFGGRRSELNVCMFTGESQPKLSQERMSKCPLVPVPAGHGRLGDLDALLEQIRDGFEKAEKWMDYVEDDPELRPRAEATVVAFWECGAKVKMAPTIVPAEGGTDNG